MNSDAQNPESSDLFGLAAEFSGPDLLLAGTRRAYEAGYRKMDAYTPFPIHGLSDALGLKRNWMPYIVLLGAISGGLAAYMLLYYSAVISYPMIVGGRPFHSWPSFLVITFEGSILLAAVFGVVGMLALNKLPMPYHPMFNLSRFNLASGDRFFLCIMAHDPKFDLEETRSFLKSLKPDQISEVEQGEGVREKLFE